MIITNERITHSTTDQMILAIADAIVHNDEFSFIGAIELPELTESELFDELGL